MSREDVSINEQEVPELTHNIEETEETHETTTKKKKVDYQNRIVLDFSPDEMEQIKTVMDKEHINFKKTMVYIMVKRYLDIYEEQHFKN